MRKIISHLDPDRFVSGTIGQPGERVFFIQVKSGNNITSVVVEKSQVAILAERIDTLLNQIMQENDNDAQVPEKFDANLLDLEPLEAPITEEFRVGVMSLGWSIPKKKLIIEAHADTSDTVPEIDSEETEGPDVLRIHIDAKQGRLFAERGRRLVSAGRQPCPFCNEPLGQRGHICARANGYKR
ncbi:unannotated protein [freshwater metagenome]|uniref:Unannotated protein n=1 Tax=freshwater metagenome TaxID=449393 RepID=A0A6J6EEV5_9ZZZZ|nr:DUF3090 family protein [Actinomycetota bacterium]